MRLCPTLAGDDRALIAHSICASECTKRQQEFYHKCHRCLFRGKAEDYVPEPQVAASRNGTASPVEAERETES